VEVLSSLFRGRMLGMLIDAHAAGRLKFFGKYQHLADSRAFRAYIDPLWTTDWFVYAKRPFAGPEQVLAYLSRYTHRVAISSSRFLSADDSGVTFRYKDLCRPRHRSFMPTSEPCRTDLERYVAVALLRRFVERRLEFHSAYSPLTAPRGMRAGGRSAGNV